MVEKHSLNFNSLIEPLTVEEFEQEYKGKKFCIIKGNKFRQKFYKDIITWTKFSDYINNDRAVAGIQAIPSKGKKLCMEKENLYRNNKPHWTLPTRFDKEYLHSIWNNNGSIILTRASLLTPNISAIAGAIEKHFKGACDAHFYCSKKSTSKSFNVHKDHDDNFLVHSYGSVKWTVANGFESNEFSVFKLTVGDMLYIPKGLYHCANPLSKRISISVPLAEIDQPLDRKYYSFT